MIKYRRGEKRATVLMFLRVAGPSTKKDIDAHMGILCGGDLSRLVKENCVSAKKVVGNKEKTYSFNRFDEKARDAISLYGLDK